MIGILTEKPSAARNFAKALLAKKNGQNFKGNFEGNDIIIVHSYGHLYGLVYPRYQVPKEKELRYASWNIQYLPWDDNDICWKKAPLPKTKEAIENIKTTLENCSEIVIATDNDPSGEGDLLAGEILLGTHLDAKKLSRMYFADESVKSIQKAFLNRKTIPKLQDNPEFKKGLYRERLDFLSMQHTRIATYYSGCNAVLRQGRLKSVMNNLVGKQFEAIDAYKKIPYYQNRFKDENGNVYINAEEEMYPNKNDVPAIYTTSSVIIDEKQIKHTAPPRLLDLAGLSSALSKKFGANTVLRTYQKMYEKQIVSYPRTEDKYISPEQFKELLPDIDKIAILVGVDSSLLTHRQPRKTHVKAGGAHGANRPGTNVPSSMDSLQQFGDGAEDIYRILALNTLAMFAEDYEYIQEKGHLEKYPNFQCVTNIPHKQGFKRIFCDQDEQDKTTGKVLGSNAVPFIHEGFPKPPVRPTMKWLMKQLEKCDVGTGATRTSIYAEITQQSGKSDYPLLHDAKGKITMTEYGRLSYKLTEGTHIADIKMTEKMQQTMREVADNRLDLTEELHQMRNIVTDDIKTVKKNATRLNITIPDKQEVITGLWQGISVAIKPTWGGHKWTKEEINKLFAGEEVIIYGLQAKDGKKYDVKGKLARQKYEGKEYVGFAVTKYMSEDRISGMWNNEMVSIKKEWNGHTWTKEELADLFDGKEIVVRGLCGKDGKKYDVKGKLAKQTYKGKKYVGLTITEYMDEDRVTGIWNGRRISIKKEWNGHTWTSGELKSLFAGEKITVYGFRGKNKKEYGVVGKLSEQSYNGRKFVGFKRLGFADN